jgi:hypothetical protein
VGNYSLLDFDTSTGAVYLAKAAPSFICLGGATEAKVDLVAGTVTSAGSMSGCSHGFASDDAGTLYNVSATELSTKITPTGVLTGLNTATGTLSTPITLRQQVPVALAVDGVHHVAVVAYASPAGTPYFGSQQGQVYDNNATGELLLVDLDSGAVLKTLTGFQVTAHGGTLIHGGLMNSLQLDPTTRTGSTYAAWDGQIQQFSY